MIEVFCVGYALVVQTCSFMYTNHIDMMAHAQPFNNLGTLSSSSRIRTHAAWCRVLE